MYIRKDGREPNSQINDNYRFLFILTLISQSERPPGQSFVCTGTQEDLRELEFNSTLKPPTGSSVSKTAVKYDMYEVASLNVFI